VIRAVLDRNVLASGIVESAKAVRAPGRLLRLWRNQRFELVVSAEILTELGRTLAKPYFRQKLTPEQIEAATFLVASDGTIIEPAITVSGVATHPEDDLVLAVAVSAEVDYLVTGDKALQRLGDFQAIQILSPRHFLDLLEARNDEML
jgi:putative PIN family toxin of toxin-antitoxin system